MEVAALKEALVNQSLVMRKLYTELEEEREASATAAAEALSMILRLQEEKAAEKLEAYQYKRMVEEKLCYAEDSMAVLEEDIFHKETEVASLKFQIQAYRQKLLRVSANNPDTEKLRSTDYSSMHSGSFLCKRSFHGSVRRNISMPATSFNQFWPVIDDIAGENFLVPRGQSTWREIDECATHFREKCEESQRLNLSEDYATHGSNSDREQAEEINIGMREFSKTRHNKEKVVFELVSENDEIEKSVAKEPQSPGPYSCYPAVNNSTSVGKIKSIDGIVSCMNSQTRDLKNIAAGDEYGFVTLGEPYRQVLKEPILGPMNMTRMSHSMPEESVNCFQREEELLRNTLLHTHESNGLSASREGASMDYNSTVVHPKDLTASPNTDIKELKQWMQQLENEVRIMKQEYLFSGKEQMNLVREIHDQLNTIQSDIKGSKFKNRRPQDDISLVSLTEAMLSFWL